MNSKSKLLNRSIDLEVIGQLSAVVFVVVEGNVVGRVGHGDKRLRRLGTTSTSVARDGDDDKDDEYDDNDDDGGHSGSYDHYRVVWLFVRHAGARRQICKSH